jgi:acetyl esterase/lipase
MKWIFLFSWLPFLPMWAHAPNTAQPPAQATAGPGGSAYAHEEVIFRDFAKNADGYWLFEPAAPAPDSAHVVVFLHGYGAYNPMIYGAWIRHLVQRGNVVIFPRYQKNLFSPTPDDFPANAATAIRDAIALLETEGRICPMTHSLTLAGHSYGGAIAAHLAVHYEAFNIPQPKALLLCSPGTGPFKGARLDSYEGIPADTRLLIMVSQNDRVVGDEFANLVFTTATNTPQRNLLRQFADSYGQPALTDHHNEPYAPDMAFDTGLRNVSSLRALRIGTVDAVDYNGYWKLLDALMDCTRTGDNCHVAFGNTPEQFSLGCWSDGYPVQPMLVTLPNLPRSITEIAR